MEPAAAQALDWLNYTQDRVRHWYFWWEWRRGLDGKYVLENIRPACRTCKCQMLPKGGAYFSEEPRLYCPNCGNVQPPLTHEDLVAVSEVIVSRVRTGHYKTTVRDG